MTALSRDHFVITEGIHGTFYYHLSRRSEPNHNKSLCDKQVMPTSIPLSTWGFKGHLNERYCRECVRLSGLLVSSAGLKPREGSIEPL